MNGTSSNSGSPALPMKFVATPRPEKNARKSIVGPCVVALRPPAHSTCATLRPARSADCAIDSACSTPGSNAAVRLANGCPFRWKVLFVEPWTPGHAPVARVYQPGAGVRRRLGQEAVARRERAVLEELATSSASRPARRTSRRCPVGARRRRRRPPCRSRFVVADVAVEAALVPSSRVTATVTTAVSVRRARVIRLPFPDFDEPILRSLTAASNPKRSETHDRSATLSRRS